MECEGNMHFLHIANSDKLVAFYKSLFSVSNVRVENLTPKAYKSVRLILVSCAYVIM